jgi:hypothetical protein
MEGPANEDDSTASSLSSSAPLRIVVNEKLDMC